MYVFCNASWYASSWRFYLNYMQGGMVYLQTWIQNMTKVSIWVLLTGQVELRWGNGEVDDIFFVAGYNLEGSVVSQVC